MEEGMKRNIIIITSAIVGIFFITWLCVKFINNDVIPEKEVEDKSENKVVIKCEKEEKIDLNGNSYNIKLTAYVETVKETDKETKEEYTLDYLKYKVLFNDKEIEGIKLESELDEIPDEIEIEDIVKTVKGNDNKDYLIMKLITYSDYGTTNENVFIINENGKLLFNYLHEISSIFYNVKGPNSKKYIIGSNNCEDFKYIDTGETLCNNFDKLYTTYKINDNNIEILECINSEDFDGRLLEKELTIGSNVVSIKNTGDKYEINDANLSGAGFICPTYKNLSK